MFLSSDKSTTYYFIDTKFWAKVINIIFTSMWRIWFLVIFLWLLVLYCIGMNGDFPLNDDWQYAYAVKNLIESGDLVYRGQFSPIVLTQVLWGALFCKITTGAFSFTALRWSTLVLVPLLLWILLKIGKTLLLTKKALLLLAISVCFMPLLMVLAPSFMSDVPFACISIFSVAAYWQFLQKEKKYYLFFALFFSVLAFYIRQPALALPIAYGFHYWWVKGRTRQQFAVTALLILFSIVILLTWEHGVKPFLGLEENFKSDMSTYLGILIDSPLSFIKTLFLRLLKSFIYIGFFSLGLLFFVWPSKFTWKKQLWVGISSIFMVILSAMTGKVFPFGGNIFYNLGLGPELLMDTYTLQLNHTPKLVDFWMYLLHFLSLFSGITIIISFVEKRKILLKSQQSYLQLWLITSMFYFPLMAITSYYDRYILFPYLLFLPILLVQFKQTKRPKLRWIPIVLLSLFSIVASHDYLAWNRAKLEAFNWLTNEGVSIQQMDAGYELNGWHNYGQPHIENDSTSFWWVTDDEYLLTFGLVDGFEQLHKVPFNRWLWYRTDDIFVLKKNTIKLLN